jgi:hypothetical protein
MIKSHGSRATANERVADCAGRKWIPGAAADWIPVVVSIGTIMGLISSAGGGSALYKRDPGRRLTLSAARAGEVTVGALLPGSPPHGPARSAFDPNHIRLRRRVCITDGVAIYVINAGHNAHFEFVFLR